MEEDLPKNNLSMKNAEVTNKTDRLIALENDKHLTSSTDTFALTSSGLNNASVIDNHTKIALANFTKINSLDITRSRGHMHHGKSFRKDSQSEKLKDATSSARKAKDVPLTMHQRFNDNSVDHSSSIDGNHDSSKLDVATSSSTVTTSLYVLTSSSMAISSLNSSGDISPGSSSGMIYRESNSTMDSGETNNTSKKTDAADDNSRSQSVELMSYSFTNAEESNDIRMLDRLQQRIDNIIATHTNSSNFFNSIAVGFPDQQLIQENVPDVTSSITRDSSINHNGTTTKQIPDIKKSYRTEQSSLTSQTLSIDEPEEMSNDFFKMPLKVIVPLIINPINIDNNTDSASGSETIVQSEKKAQDSRKDILQKQPGIIHDYGPQCSTSFNEQKKEVFDNKLQQNIAFHERLADDVSISASAEKTKTEACSTNNAASSRFERSMDAMINTNTNIKLSVLNNSMNTEQEDTGGCSIGSQCDSPSMNASTTQIFLNNLNVKNRTIENELQLMESVSINNTPIDNDCNNSVTIEQISSEGIAEETNNAKTKSIFLPHINFRNETESTSGASTSNFHFNKSSDNYVKENSTTDENIYIIEGLGYFKDTLDDLREFEEDLEKRRDPLMNYGDNVDDIILTSQDNMRQMSESVQIENGPAVEHHVSTTQFHWEGNFVDRIVGTWWPNDESRAVRALDDNVDTVILDKNMNRQTQRKDKLEIEQLRKSLRIKNVDYSLSKERSSGFYQNILLPAFYVTIGVALFGLTVWYKRALMTRKPNISGLRFFLKKRRPTHRAV